MIKILRYCEAGDIRMSKSQNSKISFDEILPNVNGIITGGYYQLFLVIILMSLEKKKQ